MGRIFYVMGKSSSGKDTIFKELLRDERMDFQRLVLYTTRPIRTGETDGVDYHFVRKSVLDDFEEEGKLIEVRCYPSVIGPWWYGTVDDGSIALEKHNYLAIGTLVSYEKLRAYFGEDRVVPIYIEVADDVRLIRAIERERQQERPAYEEMCRRFLADSEDFREEKLLAAGIDRRFDNGGALSDCLGEISSFLSEF